MKYRRFYEQETGRKVPAGFDVHHIDHDRKNCDILNLVALPIELHRKYHYHFPHAVKRLELFLPQDGENGHTLEAALVKLAQFQPVWKECLLWVQYRNWLLKLTKQKPIVQYF